MEYWCPVYPTLKTVEAQTRLGLGAAPHGLEGCLSSSRKFKVKGLGLLGIWRGTGVAAPRHTIAVCHPQHRYTCSWDNGWAKTFGSLLPWRGDPLS